MNRIPALAGTLAIVLSLLLPAGSGAQSYSGRQAKRPANIPRYHWRTMSVSETISAQRHLISLDRTAIRAWVASRWTRLSANVSVASPSRLAKPMPPEILWRQKQLGWLVRELRERIAVVVRPRNAGHWALWNCITNGAYAGAPHEGNGYNGLYTGPLGMTTPWAAHYPTGRDWVHTPIATVYGFAEQEYARHGYSRSWLYGQWPETSPPCSRFA